ncbi:MAG: DUF6036 family nucleotidyltransferase [Pseudobdellovibrionaceae bacterium]
MFLLEVCQVFKKNKVKYAVVGGYAVALHGAVRGTVDVDLVINLTVEDFSRAVKALNQINLVSRLPLTAKEVILFRLEYIEKRNLIAWSFVDPKLPSRIVDIVLTKDLKQLKTVQKKISGVSIDILSIDDLITMKKESGRPQDLQDVGALEKIRSEQADEKS